MTELSQHNRYLDGAKKELSALEGRISSLQHKRDGESGSTLESEHGRPVDFDALLADLRARVAEATEYVKTLGDKLGEVEARDIEHKFTELKAAGEERFAKLRDESEHQLAKLLEEGEARWSELQARAEVGFWDVRAMVQRASEGVAPLLRRGEDLKKRRYYLQKASRGRWALVPEGADAPTHFFANKREGEKISRQYARDHRPSELVIRRTDGTFESVHQYRA